MALEINPSATTVLIGAGVVLFVAIGMHTTGALLSLVILGLAIAVVLFITWAVGKRLARWGAGIGR